MNLFRSEEHVKNWSGFKPGTEEGMVPLQEMVQLFSLQLFTKRLDSDYMSNFQKYLDEFVGALAQIGESKPFWKP